MAVNALTLPDGQNSITVFTDNGTTSVMLLAVPVGTGGGAVQSVTAPGEEPGIIVDNSDPANPKLHNSGVIELVVDPPLVLVSGAPNVEIALPASAVGSTPLRANQNMVASVTAADGQLACATAVATTPTSSTTAGGYVGADVNGVWVSVGDGTKVGVALYFSGDGGTTARTMKNIVAGDLPYWNGSVAGYQLAATDRISLHFPVST
jgi:hypothetical protein